MRRSVSVLLVLMLWAPGCDSAEKIVEKAIEDTGPAPVVITIYNETFTPVCDLRVAPSDTDDWGDNWLVGGQQIAEDNGEFELTVMSGDYDLRFIDCWGEHGFDDYTQPELGGGPAVEFYEQSFDFDRGFYYTRSVDSE